LPKPTILNTARPAFCCTREKKFDCGLDYIFSQIIFSCSKKKKKKGELNMKAIAVTRPYGLPRTSGTFTASGSAALPDFSRFTGIDRLFDVLLDGLSLHGPSARAGVEGVQRPALDIRREEKQYVVNVEIPGVDQNDIKVEINDNELTISGEKREEYKSSDENADAPGLYTERVYGTFTRVLALPDDVDEEGITADHKNGLLTITLPRKVEEKTIRSIAVNKK
jgi:HSP20 family protein